MKIRIKRIAVIICVLSIAMGQIAFAPDQVHAQTAGKNLVVRVGYYGDDDDYRVKATLTRSQLERIGTQTNYYTNVTRVGTILYTVARGPRLIDVIEAAGIDAGSVQRIYIRTTDSKANKNDWFYDFLADSYLYTPRYYYPKINDRWQVADTGDSGTPLKGALSNARQVSTILAIESYGTKNPKEAGKLTPSMMNQKYSYRLCAGQTALREGVATTQADVTSKESAFYIFGIDIQLYGSPPADDFTVGIDLKNTSFKVGSKKNLTATINGSDFFGNNITGHITWSSSNEEVATIGRTTGVLEVKSKGTTVITATAKTSDGKTKSASVTINTTGKKEKPDDKNKDEKKAAGTAGNAGDGGGSGGSDGKQGSGQKGDGNGSALIGSEVSVDTVDNVVYDRREMSDDAVALAKEKVDPKIMIWAGIVALALFIGGTIVRTKQYFKEV